MGTVLTESSLLFSSDAAGGERVPEGSAAAAGAAAARAERRRGHAGAAGAPRRRRGRRGAAGGRGGRRRRHSRCRRRLRLRLGVRWVRGKHQRGHGGAREARQAAAPRGVRLCGGGGGGEHEWELWRRGPGDDARARGRRASGVFGGWRGFGGMGRGAGAGRRGAGCVGGGRWRRGRGGERRRCWPSEQHGWGWWRRDVGTRRRRWGGSIRLRMSLSSACLLLLRLVGCDGVSMIYGANHNRRRRWRR